MTSLLSQMNPIHTLTPIALRVILYYRLIYAWVFQMFSFLQVIRLQLCRNKERIKLHNQRRNWIVNSFLSRI
jgi:hypothetical protein